MPALSLASYLVVAVCVVFGDSQRTPTNTTDHGATFLYFLTKTTKVNTVRVRKKASTWHQDPHKNKGTMISSSSWYSSETAELENPACCYGLR